MTEILQNDEDHRATAKRNNTDVRIHYMFKVSLNVNEVNTTSSKDTALRVMQNRKELRLVSCYTW